MAILFQMIITKYLFMEPARHFCGDGLPKKFQTANMKKQSIINSFANAFNGLKFFFMNDRNGQIHLCAVLLVSLSGFYFQVSSQEWMILLLCFAGVISIEMCNHGLEKLCDLVNPAQHPTIKVIKDVAAAGVLWSAIISVLIGLIIFVPKISAL